VSERGFLIPPSRLRGRGGGTNSAGGSGSGRRVRKARGPGGDARTLHHALAFASQNLNSLMSVDDCMEEFTSLAYVTVVPWKIPKVDIAKRAMASTPSSIVLGFTLRSTTIEVRAQMCNNFAIDARSRERALPRISHLLSGKEHVKRPEV
jgi:hypothetical protein